MTINATASPIIPDTFRAYVAEGFGDVEHQIKLRTDVPQAPVGPDQVRIKIHAAAVNPVDYKLVEAGQRFMATPPSAENPLRLGFDVAGTLVEIGADVKRDDLHVADAVYAMAFFGGTGTFAEYIVINASYVAPKPTNLSFTHAAGLPLAGQTSYHALVTFGKLKKGDRVLILGGSSGTGGLAIQIAKALGASFVAATASARNIDLVKSFGADQVIDYTSEKWGDVLEPHSIDLIYDCAMEPHSWNDAAQIVLKRNTGIFVTIELDVKPIESTIGATFHAIYVNPKAENLIAMTKLIDAGKLFVPIDSVHPFEDLMDAVKVQMSGRARGKIILQVLPESSE